MFRIGFIFKLIQSHCQSLYYRYFILKIFVSIHLQLVEFHHQANFLRNAHGYCVIWVIFLGYTFLLNLHAVLPYFLAFNVPEATCHLFPCEDDLYPHPLLWFWFAWFWRVFWFFFFFKFKNITGFVLELSVLFQNFLEHSVLSLICIYSCLSISKKFSYNFTFGCIFYFILWILFQHITLVLYNFCISFLLAFS